MLIKDIYGKLWKPLPEPMQKYPKHLQNKFPMPNQETKIGIEIEAEGWIGFDCDPLTRDTISSMWSGKNEASLRDNGIEFISLPVQGNQISVALSLLEVLNNVGHLHYTDLAGLHVHLNVRDFLQSQFANLAMLYLVFEESLYRISGNRKKNIYCLPARSCWSGLPRLFTTKDLTLALRQANKYMGFNYLTIKQFGTVEFRHSKGSRDVSYIHHWICTLMRMHTAAQMWDTTALQEKIFQLNTNSEYWAFTKEIFKKDSDWIDNVNLKSEMEEGVTLLKEWFIESHLTSDKILDTAERPRKKPVPVYAKKLVFDVPHGFDVLNMDDVVVAEAVAIPRR